MLTDIGDAKVENHDDFRHFSFSIFMFCHNIADIMESKLNFHPSPDLKLMDQVREVLRYHHYAYRTEKTYCHWIRRYIHFYDCKRHPADMGAPEVERFLSNMAVKEKVSASTRKQALNALVFLYNRVIDKPFEGINPIRSGKSPKLPTVRSRTEIERFFQNMGLVLRPANFYGCCFRLPQGAAPT